MTRIDFDVTFTNGTTSRVSVEERAFPGERPQYTAPGAPPALSPERAASKWAAHQLALRSEDGDHTAGIASIRRVEPLPAKVPEMLDVRFRLPNGAEALVREHPQRPSVVVEVPLSEMSSAQGRAIADAILRVCRSLDAQPDELSARDGLVAAEEIHEGDAVVVKIGGVAGVSKRSSPSPFEGMTVKVVAEPHRDIATELARVVAESKGVDINTVLCPPDDGDAT